MKIPAARLDNFVKHIDPNLAGALIYGPDAGLADERANIIAGQIVDSANPFLIVDLSPEKIKEDPAIIMSELASTSFFGSEGRKLIRIKAAGDPIVAVLKPALDKHRGKNDPFILVVADDLPPRSSLRQLAEKQANFGSVPCYKDDSASLAAVVRNKLRENGYVFEPGVIELIASNSLGDRMVLNRELEKLFLYVGEGNKSIKLDDVYACVVESSEASLDQLCSAVADRDQKTLMIQLRRAYSEGVMPVTVLRYVSNYFTRFYNITAAIQEGKTEQEAIESLRPPVFFKQVPSLRRQVGFWGRNDGRKKLRRAFRIIMDAERECKKTGVNNELLCSHYLMQISNIN